MSLNVVTPAIKYSFPMTHFTLRKATETDAATINKFIKDLAVYERLSHECFVSEDALRQMLFGKRRFAEVVIAEDENGPLGFALYFFHFSTFNCSPTLWLEDLFVEPNERGRGIGKALLQKLCKIAAEEGCGRVEWWVLDWNEPSIEFYKSIGAKPMDDWTVFRMDSEAIGNFAAG